MPRKTWIVLACTLALAACQRGGEAPADSPAPATPSDQVEAGDAATMPASPDALLADGAGTGSSLMSIDLTQPADIGFGEALFANDEGGMHLLEPVPALGDDAWIVVGQAGAADLVVHVFVPVAGAAADRSQVPFQVASLHLPAPAAALDLEVDDLAWEGSADDARIEFRLVRRHHLLREGGDPESGDGATDWVSLPLRVAYSRASGELRVLPTDS